MSEPVKKKRIRSADLLKTSRCSGESKYDFSKIKNLKGKSGRDASKKGRPEGITRIATTGIATTSNQIDPEPYIEQTEEDIGKIDPPHDPDNICFLSEEETYINLLKENNGIYCVDDTYMTFVLHGIDFQRLRLKSSQFLFLSRRAMTFLGESHFIYLCSCDVEGRDLIQCCGEQMDVPFDEFTARHPGCLHANVLAATLEQFDAQNMIDPSNFEMDVDAGTDSTQVTEDEIIEMENGLFLVKSQKGMGVVDGTKCITCNVNVIKCVHLTIFLNTHEKHENISKAYVYKQKCYSVSSIPFHSDVAMKDMYKKSVTDRFSFENDIDSTTVLLKPNAEICDSCNSHLVEKEQTNRASIFVMNQILDAIVSVKECVGCKKQFYVDGLDLGIINMGKNVVCHNILRRFMYYFLTGKTTIFTEYSVLKKTFMDAGFQNFSEKMSYQDFKDAWYSFLDLLDMNYQNAFHCPDCGPDPDTVVMDATSVSFRKEMISWQSLFSGSNNISEPYDRADSSRVKGRTLFSRAVRLNLLDYIKPKGISKEMIEKTLNLVKIENDNNYIVDLLNIIFKNSIVKGDRYFSTDVWRNLIRALASSYPLCSFLPPSEEFFDFLESVFSGPIENVLRNDNYLKKIQTTVPVIFRLLSQLKENFPCQEFKDCLPYFKHKVFYPFLKDICPSEEPDEEDGLSFFPSLPEVRRRGQFSSDKKRSQVKDDVCSKLSKGHPSLLPGVFTLFCPHGICYGFQVMKCHESPDVPFTLLRTRFRKAPKLVIYDNACSLQAYCLNRDAKFFLDTQFRVDGLHFKNHTACGPSFELKSYPQYSELNSQVVEQSNSRLQRVKGSLSYMTQSNFMKHCKFYLWGQNDEILSKPK